MENLKNLTFIHFKSNEECNNIYEYILFISKILNLRKIITHKCCGGKGIGILISKDKFNIMVEKYELSKKIKNVAMCLLCCNTKLLYFICNNDKCKKQICLLCKNNYINVMKNADRDLICPYCRTNDMFVP